VLYRDEFSRQFTIELLGFFDVHQSTEIVKSGDYSPFSTYDGFTPVMSPLFVMALVYRKFKAVNYKISFLIF